MSGWPTKLKRSHDLAQIAHLRLHGESQAVIARALGLSQSAVSRSLTRLEREWLEEAGLDSKLVRAIDLETLRAVQAELWQAYRVSKEPRKVLRTVRREGTNPYVLQRVRTTTRSGSPLLLGLIMRCVRLECELAGLYPKEGSHPDWREELEGEQDELPLDSVCLEVIFAELLRRHGVIDVWAWGPAPPTPDQLPPGFNPPVRSEQPWEADSPEREEEGD